jgi:hypothetical protein
VAEQALEAAVPFPPAAIEIETQTALEPETEKPALSEVKPVEEPPAESAGAAEPHEAPQSAAAEFAAAASAAESAAGEEGNAPAAPSDQPEMQTHGVKVRSTPRPKGSAFGVVGQMAGMALGGVLGLAIGYYILLWIGGPRADFLHVREKLPHWVLPHKQEHHRQRWHHSAAPRSLGDLLEEDDEPNSAVKLDEATLAEDSSQPREAMPASFEQSSAEEPVNRLPPLERTPPGELATATGGGMPRLAPSKVRSPAEPGPVGPRGFNAYSVDDLDAALNKVSAALGCEYCHAAGYLLVDPPGAPPGPGPRQPVRVPCDQCGGKRTPGLTAVAFAQLCELGDAATFAQLGPDEVQREELRARIQSVLLRVGEDRGKTQIVGRLASSRLENSQRLTNGILLAGTVQELGYEGPIFRIKLVLFGVPKEVVVISEHAPQPPLASHDRVLILGSIVDSPTENLAGYEGQLTQVVWGGFPMKLVPRRQ